MGIVSGGGGGLPLTGGTLTGPLTITDTDGTNDSLVINKPPGTGAGIRVKTPLVQSSGSLLRLDGDNGLSTIAAFGGGTTGYGYWTPDNAAPVNVCLSAPADAKLDAPSCALWFDPTNGASKLMVKAKSNNGTVVTASIPLA